jgi:hypothetical protein
MLMCKSMLAEVNAICYTLNAMSKIYGLIFDVDGVIADTEAVNAGVSIIVFADSRPVSAAVRRSTSRPAPEPMVWS